MYSTESCNVRSIQLLDESEKVWWTHLPTTSVGRDEKLNMFNQAKCSCLWEGCPTSRCVFEI